jgi:hypothetical protein
VSASPLLEKKGNRFRRPPSALACCSVFSYAAHPCAHCMHMCTAGNGNLKRPCLAGTASEPACIGRGAGCLQDAVHPLTDLWSWSCAVVGFTLGFLTQLRTGVSVWGQLNAFPFAYLWAYGLVVIGSLLNQ